MPLLWISLAFLTGDITASLLHLEYPAWLAGFLFACVCTLLIFLFRRIARLSRWTFSFPHRLPLNPIPYPVLLLFFFLGGLRFVSSQPELVPGFIGYHAQSGEAVVIEGLVSRPPVQRDRYLSVEVEPHVLITADGAAVKPLNGRLQVTLLSSRRIEYGDQIRLEGRLELAEESEDFSYRSYLAGRGIYAVMAFPKLSILEFNQGSPLMDWIYRLRAKSVDTIYDQYPDPEASLLAGILLGVEEGIPDDVEAAFRSTGTSHIIVISGFNISIIARLLFSIFSAFLRRWWGSVAAVIGIAFYTLLVGAEPPVVRAAIMGSMAILGRQIGRSGNAFNSLLLTAALMVLVEPGLPSQVSFQLSFMATLGMMLFADPLSDRLYAWLEKKFSGQVALRLGGVISEGLLVTLAAQVLTLPLILYHFGRLSLVSLLANPLILPVQPMVMVLGGLSVLLGLVYPPFGTAVHFLAWPVIAYTVRMVELFAGFPWAEVSVPPIAPGWLVLFFALALFGAFQPEKLKLGLKKFRTVIVLGGLIVLTIYVWGAALSTPDGRLHVTLLETDTRASSGQALLIQTPQGRRILIGGGPSAKQLSSELGRRLVFRKSIDWLVIPVPVPARTEGLVNVSSLYPPGNVSWAGDLGATASARRLFQVLNDADITITPMEAGQAFDLGEGCRLEVLSVTAEGADLLLSWQNFRLLIPAGENFPKGYSQVSGIVLPPGVSIERDHLVQFNPQFVLVSGYPQQAGVFAGYNLLSTVQNGWIEVITDGDQLWVQVEQE